MESDKARTPPKINPSGEYLLSDSFSDEARKRKFVEELLRTIADIDSSLSDVILIFFPVVRSFHIYLFVIDIRRPSFLILDNIMHDDTLEALYSSLPYVIRDYMFEYLSSVQHPKAKYFKDIC
ncbi:hypothetical protein L2E82_05626 [Cichorium intybus]|uniref:Uncharacterized protein n=1 Tax=Cichorium intybus TaxID=13427 RepID=A0ACB9H8W9_CICIN|nr:hypothetical protein L2E82_05626 [Cichorium intybus]